MDSDSGSSVEDADIETNVLLGYASKEPTGDDFSRLGGQPTWLDGKPAPSGSFAKCKGCGGVMSLLLQLDGNLREWFPGHERKLYVFGCRRKACRRKDGSIRALRAVRTSAVDEVLSKPDEKANETSTTTIGETLFGVKSPTPAQANPFTSPAATAAAENPFSSGKGVSTGPSVPMQSQTTNDLPETFAQKARISSPEPSKPALPLEPWPKDLTPFRSYYVDAGKEYLDPETEAVPRNARVDLEGGESSTADDKSAFESSMDKTFQRFADRLAQNPEQVLRYEFAGQPLLYSKSDKVGQLLSSAAETKIRTSSSHKGAASSNVLRVPRCMSCGAARVFELQLTPHTIDQLEAEETSIDGMDWGTVIVGVCSEDCQEKSKGEGEVGYLEEWAGVQWEEILDRRQA